MTNKILSRFVTATSVAALTFGLSVQGSQAQSDSQSQGIETVVVTGSLIGGTAEKAAFPVTVITADDLLKRGSPSMTELFKSMPEMSGVMGDEDSFEVGRGEGMEGTQSVNLRGLGPERTLVLLNGHRIPLVSDYIVNTGSIPISAIARVEVLKDGAAATYGSDAIGGVVNFITKHDFDGFEASGDYTAIRGSAGDYNLNVTWGQTGPDWSVLVSGGFQHESTLSTLKRSWIYPGIEVNGHNIVYSSSPSEFKPVAPNGSGYLAPIGPLTLDVGCLQLGLSNYPYASYCRANNNPFYNLVSKKNSFQLYSEADHRLGDWGKLHLEGTYAFMEIPHYRYAPTFNEPKAITETVLPSNIDPATFVPGTSPALFNNFFVPMTNPGLAAYAAANPSQFPSGTTGIFIPVGLWRPYFAGGSPLYGPTKGSYGVRRQKQYRFSGDITGVFSGTGITWDFNATYGQNEYYLQGFDTSGAQLELALRGYGGPNCNFQTGTPGVGDCMWLNPMSNAIASAPLFGVASNPNYDPAVANSKALAQWLMNSQESWETSSTTEVNLVFNGDAWELPGGAINWAVGGQYRRLAYNAHFSKLANADASPCPDSILPIPGANVCTPSPNTPLGLAVANHNVNSGTDVYAAYAEADFPITHRLDLDVAARYENYGGAIGSTFNPQVRGKYQVMDWLTFRGSIGTTFRAPPTLQLVNNAYTTLQGVLGDTRPVDFIGNPNLKPEKATVFSLGALVDTDHFSGAVDYYNYDIKNIITTEPLANILNYVFPNGDSGPNNCATVDPTFLAEHFVFAGACSAMNLQRVETSYTNGPSARVQGVDLRATYQFGDVLGGDVSVGANASYTFQYQFAGFTVGSLPVPGFDGVGKLNWGTLGYPVVRTKGYFFLNYAGDGYNVRWGVRYNSSYVDTRFSKGTPGHTIASRALNDVSATIDMPWNTQLLLAVDNIFDENPPFAQEAFSYDPLTGDPLGRTFKIGLSAKM